MPLNRYAQGLISLLKIDIQYGSDFCSPVVSKGGLLLHGWRRATTRKSISAWYGEFWDIKSLGPLNKVIGWAGPLKQGHEGRGHVSSLFFPWRARLSPYRQTGTQQDAFPSQPPSWEDMTSRGQPFWWWVGRLWTLPAWVSPETVLDGFPSDACPPRMELHCFRLGLQLKLGPEEFKQPLPHRFPRWWPFHRSCANQGGIHIRASQFLVACTLFVIIPVSPIFCYSAVEIPLLLMNFVFDH